MSATRVQPATGTTSWSTPRDRKRTRRPGFGSTSTALSRWHRSAPPRPEVGRASSVVDKVVEAKFGRRAPQEVCEHVGAFVAPPGGS